MAIAVDATSSQRTTGTSQTTAHTCTGSDRCLFVGFFAGTSDIVTGVTYAAVAMSQIGKAQVTGDRWVYLYRLVAPSTGTNNIVISCSGSTLISCTNVSYTGVDQTNPINVSNPNSQNAQTSYTNTVTTTTTGWTMFMVKDDVGGMAAGAAPTTIRILDAGGDNSGLYDSNGNVSAGSNSLNVTNSSADFASIMVGITPSGSGGPATVKTWDTVTQSTGIKTYGTASLATTKSVDGAA